MKERIISEKFSFEEICNLLKNRADDFWDCFDNIFSLALMFFPDIKIPLGISDTIFDDKISIKLKQTKEGLKNTRKSIKKLIKKPSAQNYYKKYNDIQIANFLLIFSSYFDALNNLIPDENYCINLSATEKLYISQEHFNEYLKEAIRSESVGDSFINKSVPELLNLIVPYEHSIKVLKAFYKSVNDSFCNFYVNLISFESLQDHEKDKVMAYIKALPEIATEYYKAEYHTLKSEFLFYRSYAETAEKQQAIDYIDKAIQDFKTEQIDWLYKYKDSEIEKVFNQLNKHYNNIINQKILYGDNKEDDEAPMLPNVKDIFVPQSFKYLIYNKYPDKEPIRLEPDCTWEELEENDSLTDFVLQSLNHPIYGRKPLIVLGNPGAGKSTLSHMLASRTFSKIYNTIIIRLREVNANDEISTQIEQQIYKAIHTSAKWSDIRDCLRDKDNKPLLLIFDGFDELLQASGREYRNYIKTIHRFQVENEREFGFFVKTIVTSRRTLIDTADINNNSVIINLLEFNYPRIQIWTSIWNEKNKIYFNENNTKPFEIEETNNYYHLATQPLLLSLLAIYDYNGNTLSKDKSLDITQLYDKLIKDFIRRERNKSELFNQCGTEEELDEDYYNLNIAAIGMFNRNSTILSADEFIKDLKCFHAHLAESNSTLNQGLKTFGSFFFINTSKSAEEIKREIETKNAYEFMHNTFGEFLAGDFILKQCVSSLLSIDFANHNHRDISLEDKWFFCMSIVPLFSRPNIIKMIFLASKHKKITKPTFDLLITKELDCIISGEKVIELNSYLSNKTNPYDNLDILNCLAIYSINLIILSGILFDSEYCIELEKGKWNKLLNLWRYAFDEDELYKFSLICNISFYNNAYIIKYISNSDSEYENYETHQSSRLNKINTINKNLCDEINFIFSGALIGDFSSMDSMAKNGFDLQPICVFNHIQLDFRFKKYDLSYLRYACKEANNINYMTLFLKYINHQLSCGRHFKKQFVIDTVEDVFDFLQNGIDYINYVESYYYDDRTELYGLSELFSELLDLACYYPIDSRMFFNISHMLTRTIYRKSIHISSVFNFYNNNIQNIFEYSGEESLMFIEHTVDGCFNELKKGNATMRVYNSYFLFLNQLLCFIKERHIFSSHKYIKRLLELSISIITTTDNHLSKDIKENMILCLCNWNNIITKEYSPLNNDKSIKKIYHSLSSSHKLEWVDNLLNDLTRYKENTVVSFLNLINTSVVNLSRSVPEYVSLRIIQYLNQKGSYIPINVLERINNLSILSSNYGLTEKIQVIKESIVNDLSKIG